MLNYEALNFDQKKDRKTHVIARREKSRFKLIEKLNFIIDDCRDTLTTNSFSSSICKMKQTQILSRKLWDCFTVIQLDWFRTLSRRCKYTIYNQHFNPHHRSNNSCKSDSFAVLLFCRINKPNIDFGKLDDYMHQFKGSSSR
jgi:hypothetical protein